jgi:UDP-glucose-4-epimerase GalE
MKVLVTGGSGYIGSHAVRELTQAGHEVIIVDNLSTGRRRLSDGFELVEIGIADRERMAPLLDRVDAVMHFAASAYVGESCANPRKYFQNNVESGLALMDAVLASRVRMFVFSSSCAIYGIPGSLPVTEASPKEPINPYGSTKLFFEEILSAYAATYQLRYVALRYFNAAGAHENGMIGEIHDPETHLIPLAFKSVLGVAPPLSIFGSEWDTPDGSCIRDYVHVSDLAAAHLLALNYLGNGGVSTCLNLGTGNGTSIRELMARFKQLTGLAVPHRFAPQRPGDPPSLFADPSKAKAVLGWTAKRDLDQILMSAWKWQQRLEEAGYENEDRVSSF